MNGSLPRIPLAHLPTPVESLPRLSALLEGPNLWVKRDDQTGLAFGGNKTRKLEFLIAEARAAGAGMLITGGALQSNHCRQTAAAAARLGLRCHLVLSGDPSDRPSGNFLLDHMFGAEMTFASRAGRSAAMEQTYQQALQKGESPYLIPYGGSNPAGAAAYAYALQELLDQGISPDWIVLASSSGGTQAGLVAGALRARFPGKILGISIEDEAEIVRARIAGLANATMEKLGSAERSVGGSHIRVEDGYLGGGYGVLGEREREAIRLFALHEGLLLDPVYTGRAAAGLIDLIRNRFFKADENVLFWHTGGTPALLADRYQDELLWEIRRKNPGSEKSKK